MRLNNEEITTNPVNIPDWQLSGNSILKDFTFPDFSNALAFIVQVGLLAEKSDHHPEILLHSWNNECLG